MRPYQKQKIILTLSTAAGLLGAAITLFIFKQHVQDNLNILAKLDHQVAEERAAIATLEVELEYLSRPQRLQELCTALGSLHPIEAKQVRVVS